MEVRVTENNFEREHLRTIYAIKIISSETAGPVGPKLL
jgi:hypothetical protein